MLALNSSIRRMKYRTYHAVRLVILNEQDPVAFVPNNLLDNLGHGFEIVVNLSHHVPVAILAQIASVFRVEDI